MSAEFLPWQNITIEQELNYLNFNKTVETQVVQNLIGDKTWKIQKFIVGADLYKISQNLIDKKKLKTLIFMPEFNQQRNTQDKNTRWNLIDDVDLEIIAKKHVGI